MISLNEKFRIVKIDRLNYTFEELATINKKDGSQIQEWKQTGGYYNDINQTCKALKDYIIQQNVDDVTDVYGLIQMLCDIQCKYAEVEFITKEK